MLHHLHPAHRKEAKARLRRHNKMLAWDSPLPFKDRLAQAIEERQWLARQGFYLVGAE
jgi:hypothetical protein